MLSLTRHARWPPDHRHRDSPAFGFRERPRRPRAASRPLPRGAVSADAFGWSDSRHRHNLGVLLVRLLLGISGYLLAPALGGSAENQIAGRAAFALRFNFVARPEKAWPRATPIVSAATRPREHGPLDEEPYHPCPIR